MLESIQRQRENQIHGYIVIEEILAYYVVFFTLVSVAYISIKKKGSR